MTSTSCCCPEPMWVPSTKVNSNRWNSLQRLPISRMPQSRIIYDKPHEEDFQNDPLPRGRTHNREDL